MKPATRQYLLAWILLGSISLPSAASIDKQWNFKVYLDEKEIGYHTFRLDRDGDTHNVFIEARFKVRFFGIPFYTYNHDNHETWNSGCLREISAVTDDNGKKFRVEGAAGQPGFALQTLDKKQLLPACVSTFTYWDKSFLENKKLLNPQTGEYLDVNSRFRGKETIEHGGKSIPALRYRLENHKFSIDIWYSENDEWLGLESTTEGGRILRYVIDQP